MLSASADVNRGSTIATPSGRGAIDTDWLAVFPAWHLFPVAVAPEWPAPVGPDLSWVAVVESATETSPLFLWTAFNPFEDEAVVG